METTEAMKQIEEIHKVIRSSNRAVFSGERMMVIGFMVCLIPVIEWLTEGLTFGSEAISSQPMLISLIHIVFYWGIFSIAGRALPFKKLDRNELHPLIQKAFSVSRPFMVALFGIIFSFVAIGQGQLIHPMVFVLLGFLFSIYGKFSIQAVSIVAWTYIVGGVLYAYLTKFNLPHLWIYFTAYNGLSLIVMGIFLKKTQDSAHERT